MRHNCYNVSQRVGAVYQIRVVLYDMEMGVEICIGLTHGLLKYLIIKHLRSPWLTLYVDVCR